MTDQEYDQLKLDWTITSTDPNLRKATPGARYLFNLVNNKASKPLCYAGQDYGINLEFKDSAANNVLFTKQDGSDTPITFNEPIAIAIVKGGYLFNKPRDYGINVAWSKTPVFEWQIVGGIAGDPVTCDALVGVYNAAADDCLFNEVRDFGVNLKWVRDKGNHMKWQRLAGVAGALNDVRKLGDS